jgi:hypothetical protein
MASTAEKNRKQTKKFLFDVLNYNFLKPNIAKRTTFPFQIKIYCITTKSQNISGFFARLRNFMVGLADKPNQDLATVVVCWLQLLPQYEDRQLTLGSYSRGLPR